MKKIQFTQQLKKTKKLTFGCPDTPILAIMLFFFFSKILIGIKSLYFCNLHRALFGANF